MELQLVDIVNDGMSCMIQSKNINGSSLQAHARDKSPARISIVLLRYSTTQHTDKVLRCQQTV